uniref:Uncharacterized protein n=1 Tax=Biomphalaria glabrata TaxID=6526 RepID=A0A2C9LCX4_BIOGL
MNLTKNKVEPVAETNNSDSINDVLTGDTVQNEASVNNKGIQPIADSSVTSAAATQIVTTTLEPNTSSSLKIHATQADDASKIQTSMSTKPQDQVSITSTDFTKALSGGVSTAPMTEISVRPNEDVASKNLDSKTVQEPQPKSLSQDTSTPNLYNTGKSSSETTETINHVVTPRESHGTQLSQGNRSFALVDKEKAITNQVNVTRPAFQNQKDNQINKQTSTLDVADTSRKQSKIQPSYENAESDPAMKKVVDEYNGRHRALLAANSNSLVWKDKKGNLFTTSDSNISKNTSKLSDVLDAFNFNRPELMIRLLGTPDQDKSSLYGNRELPDLEYCVSYTGKGGIIILPQPLRRRLVQLVDDIGAWIVSDYEGTDIIESTNQPYVLPKQLKPKFYSDNALWPPSFTYSSVRLAYTRRSKNRVQQSTVGNDDSFFESVIVSNGDIRTIRELLELVRQDKSSQPRRFNVILLKGSGGLADILASAQDEKWSCNDVNNELKKLEESEEESFEDSDDENFNSREQVKQHSNAGSVIKNVILSEQDYKTLCAITSVFEPDLTLADYGLGRTILLSILKVYPEKKWKLLKLCVQLGCFDVAKKYVLQDKTSVSTV